MKYLLDTNTVIAFLKGNATVIEKMRQNHHETVIPSIVMFELYFGAENSQRKTENHENLRKLPFEVVNFTSTDGYQSGCIRNALKQKGTPIGVYDVLIAGQAVNRDLILVTNNVKEFSRVDELKWQDWLTD